MVPIENTSELVQLMSWCQTDDKRLPDSMVAQFIDTCMNHRNSRSSFVGY